jgi:hypothetical protein
VIDWITKLTFLLVVVASLVDVMLDDNLLLFCFC